MENDPHRYYSIKGPVRAQITVEGSRFIGTAAPAASKEEAQQLIDEVKAEYPDATHHTFAYRIGAASALLEQSSDDREPAGTAGAPMLQVLQGEELSDVVVVGTRYFGGVKLGIGGLSRAYRGCVRACLGPAVLVVREQLTRYILTVAYGDLGALQRHIQALGGEIIYVNYTEEVIMTAVVPTRQAQALVDGLAEISRGQARWEKIKG